MTVRRYLGSGVAPGGSVDAVPGGCCASTAVSFSSVAACTAPVLDRVVVVVPARRRGCTLSVPFSPRARMGWHLADQHGCRGVGSAAAVSGGGVGPFLCRCAVRCGRDTGGGQEHAEPTVPNRSNVADSPSVSRTRRRVRLGVARLAARRSAGSDPPTNGGCGVVAGRVSSPMAQKSTPIPVLSSVGVFSAFGT